MLETYVIKNMPHPKTDRATKRLAFAASVCSNHSVQSAYLSLNLTAGNLAQDLTGATTASPTNLSFIFVELLLQTNQLSY